MSHSCRSHSGCRHVPEPDRWGPTHQRSARRGDADRGRGRDAPPGEPRGQPKPERGDQADDGKRERVAEPRERRGVRRDRHHGGRRAEGEQHRGGNEPPGPPPAIGAEHRVEQHHHGHRDRDVVERRGQELLVRKARPPGPNRVSRGYGERALSETSSKVMIASERPPVYLSPLVLGCWSSGSEHGGRRGPTPEKFDGWPSSTTGGLNWGASAC